jgi:hypothetical protein
MKGQRYIYVKKLSLIRKRKTLFSKVTKQSQAAGGGDYEEHGTKVLRFLFQIRLRIPLQVIYVAVTILNDILFWKAKLCSV